MAEKQEPLKHFRIVIKNYRIHFGLSQGDVAELLNVPQPEYSDYETGNRGIDLNRADKVASIYGLTYYQLGNPTQKIPKFDKLPLLTQNLVRGNQEKGTKLRNNTLDLGGHLDVFIEQGKLNEPITSKELWELLPEDTRNGCSSTDITGLFKKSPRNRIIEKVGKKGKEFLFKRKHDNQNNEK